MAQRRRARKAVITAAGRGTRQFPATRSIQKRCFPWWIRTVSPSRRFRSLSRNACEAVSKRSALWSAGAGRSRLSGISEGWMRTSAHRSRARPGRWSRRINSRICSGVSAMWSSPRRKGSGHAVFQARDWVGSEPFLLLLGDHVYTTPPGVPPCAARLLDIGEREGCSVTSVRLDPEDAVSVTGVVKCQARDAALPADAPARPTTLSPSKKADAGRGARLCHARCPRRLVSVPLRPAPVHAGNLRLPGASDRDEHARQERVPANIGAGLTARARRTALPIWTAPAGIPAFPTALRRRRWLCRCVAPSGAN